MFENDYSLIGCYSSLTRAKNQSKKMPKEHRYIITEYSLNKSILGKSDFIDFQYLSNHWHYGIDTNYNFKEDFTGRDRDTITIEVCFYWPWSKEKDWEEFYYTLDEFDRYVEANPVLSKASVYIKNELASFNN